MNSRPAAQFLLIQLAAWLLPLPGADAWEDAKAEKPKQVLRILAVGDAPPFRQEIRDGVRHEVDPPEGSIPPRWVQVAVPDEAAPKPVRLALGRTSEAVFVPAGALGLHEAQEDGARKEKCWHALQLPSAPAALALLWRDAKAKSWSEARSLVLPDQLDRFPPGALRFINLTGSQAAITLGGQEFALEPGKSVVVGAKGEVVQRIPLVVRVADGRGGWIPVANTALNQASNERSNVICYAADGLKPRNPVKLSVIRERAVLPLPPNEPQIDG